MANEDNTNIDDFEIDSMDGMEEIGEEVVVETSIAEPVSNKIVSKDDVNFDFDFGEIPGVIVGDMGLQITRFPVERAKFTKDARSLISVITDKVVAVKCHYRQGLGSYLCFGGQCCEVDGLPRIKYVFPIVRYDTNKKGVPVTKDLTFEALAIGQEQYESMLAISELNGNLSKLDLMVLCNDEQYQKLSFAAAGPTRWKKNSQMVASVKEFWGENMKDLIKGVAREISPQQLSKEVAQDGIEPSGEVNFDDVFQG